MTTYNTGNPVPSGDARDRFDNSQTFDELLNGPLGSYVNRVGVTLQSWKGFQEAFNQFLLSSGYEFIGDYDADGPLLIQRINQIFSKDGEFWRAAAPPPGPGPVLPYTTVNNWVTDQPKFVSIGDASLRQALAAANGAENIGYRNAGTDVYDKLSESISAADKGATAAAANNTAAINAAIAEAGVRGRVYLGDSYKIADPSALVTTNGPQFFGPGEILTAAQVPADGFRQVNTYADNNPVGIGREYLHRCYQYFELGQSGPTGTLKVNLYGDSTVAGGNGEAARFNPKPLMENIFLNKGIANVAVTNRGVGGSQISASQAQAVADLAGAPGLYILKSFINEGTQALATRLADTETQLENWLAAVRGGGVNGDLGHLAIIVMGPNSTNNTRYQRDAFWYEQLRGMIIAKCRKYKAAYFDTYQMLQDTLQASTIGYMDAPYPDRLLDSVHPLNDMNAQIWGGMMEWALPDETLYQYRSNNFSNVGSVNGSALFATLPNQYPLGQSWWRATLAGGWPIDGMVMVDRSVDEIAVQRLIPFAADDSRMLIRTANVAGNTWNQFSGTSQPLTFLNSWVDYGAPASYAITRAIKTADGLVKVQGAIKNGVTAAGNNMAQLPVGYRPSAPEYFPCYTGGATGWLIVDANGFIMSQTTMTAALVTLSSIMFRAA